MRALSWGFRLQFLASTGAVRPRWRSSICARQKKARRSAGDQRAQDASLSSRCATGSGRKSRAEVRTSGTEMIRGFAQTGIELLEVRYTDRMLPPAYGLLSR